MPNSFPPKDFKSAVTGLAVATTKQVKIRGTLMFSILRGTSSAGILVLTLVQAHMVRKEQYLILICE